MPGHCQVYYMPGKMTLEAIWINAIKPELNTKDEYGG